VVFTDMRDRIKSIDRLDDKNLENLSNSVELLVNLSQSRKSSNESKKLYLINLILVELKIEKKNDQLVAYVKENPLFELIRDFNN
jgi:hypothetical protein